MDEPTLSELFARDPLSLSQSDINRIIEKMREARKNFKVSGKAEPRKGPIDLKELGLL